MSERPGGLPPERKQQSEGNRGDDDTAVVTAVFTGMARLQAQETSPSPVPSVETGAPSPAAETHAVPAAPVASPSTGEGAHGEAAHGTSEPAAPEHGAAEHAGAEPAGSE